MVRGSFITLSNSDMNFGEVMEVILNELVVRKYPPIERVTHIEYSDFGSCLYYEIIYTIKEHRNKEVDALMRMDIISNTWTVARMVGLGVDDKYHVHFSDIERGL